MEKTIKLNLSATNFNKTIPISKIEFNKFKKLRIGSIIPLDTLNIAEKDIKEQLKSYKTVLITGGSTRTGTPLYSAICQQGYKKVSYKQNIAKGIQKKRRVYGNIVSEEVTCLNMKLCL